jgi:hypothetical protein
VLRRRNVIRKQYAVYIHSIYGGYLLLMKTTMCSFIFGMNVPGDICFVLFLIDMLLQYLFSF